MDANFQDNMIVDLGTNISAPVPRTTSQLSAAVREKIESGEYMLGDLIEPKKFPVFTTDDTGNLQIF